MECIKPGYLTECKIKEILENGIKVKIFKAHIGYIFQDHLAKPLMKYHEDEKILCRVIHTDLKNSFIALSEKKHIVNWKPIQDNSCLL